VWDNKGIFFRSTHRTDGSVGQQQQQQQQGPALILKPVSLTLARRRSAWPKYRSMSELNWKKHIDRKLEIQFNSIQFNSIQLFFIAIFDTSKNSKSKSKSILFASNHVRTWRRILFARYQNTIVIESIN
jgi:hypothetical protein